MTALHVAQFRPSITALLVEHGAEVEPGTGWVSVRCPFHDDAQASASVNEAEGVYVCHACGVKGDAAAVLEQVSRLSPGEAKRAAALLPQREQAPPPQRPSRAAAGRVRQQLSDAMASYAGQVEGAANYLAGRGIGRDAASAARLGYVGEPMPGHESYTGRLAIPYMTPHGCVDLRFRAIGDRTPKYLSLPGQKPRLYNASAVITADMVAITEGELDALVLTHVAGIPAVGVPGATQWQPHWARVFEDVEVRVVGDGDQAGRAFARRVAAELPGSVVVPMPDGHDANSLLVAEGVAALRRVVTHSACD